MASVGTALNEFTVLRTRVCVCACTCGIGRIIPNRLFKIHFQVKAKLIVAAAHQHPAPGHQRQCLSLENPNATKTAYCHHASLTNVNPPAAHVENIYSTAISPPFQSTWARDSPTSRSPASSVYHDAQQNLPLSTKEKYPLP